MTKLTSAILAAAISIAVATPATASVFWGGTVINISRHDTLKIRKWPSASSQVIDAYSRNEPISLTGRCKNIITNVSFRIDAGGSAGWKYSRMEKPNVWCQVMTDGAEAGWARGRFIWPE